MHPPSGRPGCSPREPLLNVSLQTESIKHEPTTHWSPDATNPREWLWGWDAPCVGAELQGRAHAGLGTGQEHWLSGLWALGRTCPAARSLGREPSPPRALRHLLLRVPKGVPGSGQADPRGSPLTFPLNTKFSLQRHRLREPQP